MKFILKERLYELLNEPKKFLYDGEKLTLEREGIKITLFNDGEELLIYEESID